VGVAVACGGADTVAVAVGRGVGDALALGVGLVRATGAIGPEELLQAALATNVSANAAVSR